jgi:hypothetical protein
VRSLEGDGRARYIDQSVERTGGAGSNMRVKKRLGDIWHQTEGKGVVCDSLLESTIMYSEDENLSWRTGIKQYVECLVQ